MNLSELHADPQKMIAWLAYDGVVPTVQVQTAASRMRWGQKGSWASKTEEKPVNDTETLAQWWYEYRQYLANEWAKINPHRPKTNKQEMGQILRELGYKTGTVDARLKQAREAMLQVGTVIIPNPYLNKTPQVDVMLDPCPHCGEEIDCTALRCPCCGKDL